MRERGDASRSGCTGKSKPSRALHDTTCLPTSAVVRKEARMERLTVKANRPDGSPVHWSIGTKKELVQRLAQYEDLDPDPEHLRERLERAEGVKLRRADQ